MKLTIFKHVLRKNTACYTAVMASTWAYVYYFYRWFISQASEGKNALMECGGTKYRAQKVIWEEDAWQNLGNYTRLGGVCFQ